MINTGNSIKIKSNKIKSKEFLQGDQHIGGDARRPIDGVVATLPAVAPAAPGRRHRPPLAVGPEKSCLKDPNDLNNQNDKWDLI